MSTQVNIQTPLLILFLGINSDASVFNDDWIVWYKINGKHYEVVMNESNFRKIQVKYMGVAFFIALSLFVLWQLRGKF